MGGSGDYKYKVSGTINTNYTTTDSITGLPAGTYTVYVTDINTNCTDSILRVVVPGSYLDPRFSIRKKDVTCDNAANGAIFLDSIAVSYTHLRAHETVLDLVCRLLLEKKQQKNTNKKKKKKDKMTRKDIHISRTSQ